jgi:hypothetical protein
MASDFKFTLSRVGKCSRIVDRDNPFFCSPEFESERRPVLNSGWQGG